MAEEEVKVQRFLRVPISEKDFQFLKALKSSRVKAINARLRANFLVLVDKVKRGVYI